MSDLDWPIVRKQIIFLILILLEVIGGAFGGLYYQEEMSTQVNVLQSRLQSLVSKRQAQEEQTRVLGQYKPKFDQYRVAGVFDAEEPRLHWVEHLLAVEKLLELSAPLRFKLDLRKPFSPAFSVPKDGERVFASTMEVSLELLHEGDLLYFFKQLAKREYGVYDVRSCKIERASKSAGAPNPLKLAAHMNAVCQINWYWYDLSKKQKRGAS